MGRWLQEAGRASPGQSLSLLLSLTHHLPCSCKPLSSAHPKGRRKPALAKPWTGDTRTQRG